MTELSDYLAARREPILQAWSAAVNADKMQTTAPSLTRAQFNDHIHEILEAFERRLRTGDAHQDSQDGKAEEVKHGVTRWQQGYRLHELMREWGHLQLCLLQELGAFGALNPDFDRESLADAARNVTVMVNEAIGQSAAQYELSQQAEAASHVDDLMGALSTVLDIESRRSTLIHQAVHDLHNNIYSVGMTAGMLAEKEIAETKRLEFAAILQRGVKSVTVMLGDLMELARLEAGQEKREVGPFDAAALIEEVCDINRAVARERNLFLKVDLPPSLPVEGDPGKVRRLLENLLRNALKYTEHGGVHVACGEDAVSWCMSVRDTGPGVKSGTETPLLTEMKKATEIAAEVEGGPVAKTDDAADETPPPPDASPTEYSAKSTPGEGIGLSIVKRLCDLLDASLEVTTPDGHGTMFKVVFPKRY
ncbi:MAG: sensor histidine kinase [Burkholderiales bacterium]|nr:sensor histidine kinase [Opitutaceae bacterium]